MTENLMREALDKIAKGTTDCDRINGPECRSVAQSALESCCMKTAPMHKEFWSRERLHVLALVASFSLGLLIGAMLQAWLDIR